MYALNIQTDSPIFERGENLQVLEELYNIFTNPKRTKTTYKYPLAGE